MSAPPPMPDDPTIAPVFRRYWVLLIDLAGFSNAIASEPRRSEVASTYSAIAHELVNDLANAISDSRSDQFRTGWARRVRIFSDSLFFFFDGDLSPDAPWANPSNLTLVAAAVSVRLWSSAIPHRGAIAHGECYVDERGSVFLGMPIVRAHQWEQSQDWLGISVEPGSLRMAEQATGFRLRDRLVPTKYGRVRTRCVPYELGSERQFINGFFRSYETALAAGNVPAIPKYIETAEFLLECGLVDPRLRELVPPDPRSRGSPLS